MSFQRSDLLLLLVVPVISLIVAWLAANTARRRRTQLLGSMRDVLAPGFSMAQRIARDGIGLLGLALVIAALAGPMYGTFMQEVQQRGVDLVVVLDTSRSMLAEDVLPSRLERAKREVRGLLDKLSGHRLGLVTFAGNAQTLCPLTHDGTTLRVFLDEVDTSINGRGGTAIGEGIELALDALGQEGNSEPVIVLLTDGEDHDSDPPPDEVAYQAKARGVPIHVVSLGTAAGGFVPIPRPKGPNSSGGVTLLKDANGQPVRTRPDEVLLQRIADISGGSYLSADRSAFPLDEIFDKRVAVMEGVSRASSVREMGIDRFQWALVVALACLAVAHLLGDGGRP